MQGKGICTYRIIQRLPESALDYGNYTAWLLGGATVVGAWWIVSDLLFLVDFLIGSECTIFTDHVPGLWFMEKKHDVSLAIFKSGHLSNPLVT